MPTFTVRSPFAILSLKSIPVTVRDGRTAPLSIVEVVAITLAEVTEMLMELLAAAGAIAKAEV